MKLQIFNDVVISAIFLSQRMCYPVRIHRCKHPNCDFCISQGSVTTVLRWGNQNNSHQLVTMQHDLNMETKMYFLIPKASAW